MKRLLNSLGAGTLIFCIGCMMLVYYAFFEDIKVTYKEGTMADLTGAPRVVFNQGEPMFMHRMICKTKNVPGLVDRELYNTGTGAIYPLARVPTGLFMGCADRNVAIVLPVGLPEGLYEYRSKAVYQVNPIRQVITTAPPISFEIRK